MPTPDNKDDYTWPEAFHDVSVLLNKSRKLITHIPRSIDIAERHLNELLTEARDTIDKVLSSKEYKHENRLDVAGILNGHIDETLKVLEKTRTSKPAPDIIYQDEEPIMKGEGSRLFVDLIETIKHAKVKKDGRKQET